jgi:hypothetical protein
MQVCLNGHVITDRFNTSPEFRKNFCTECGANTITTCSNCNSPIPGDMIYENVINLMSRHPVAPKICANCGSKFPWYEKRVQDDEYERKLYEDKKAKKDRQDQLAGLKKIEVKIEGHGNVFSLGNIADNVIANTVKLSETGQSDIALALKTLTDEIRKSNEISEAEKEDYLQQISTLSTEALKSKENRLPQAVLKPIIKFGLEALTATAHLAEVWHIWGDKIAAFFLS